MDLFNIIKYGSTDLGSEEELRKLPLGLVDLYYAKSWESTITERNRTFMYSELARWYNAKYFKEEQIRFFKEALREYNEPI